MTSTKYSRRSAREAVLQALYALEIGEESRSKVIKDILAREIRDKELDNFIIELFEVSLKNREWCENLIKSRLNNWEFERESKIFFLSKYRSFSEGGGIGISFLKFDRYMLLAKMREYGEIQVFRWPSVGPIFVD